jgi:ribosomal protein S18 acetylase RimI-like enzyme
VPSDVEVVRHFVQALADFEGQPNAVEVTAEAMRAQMQSDDPPFECLLAEDAGKPIGFALYYRNYSTWPGRPGLYIEDLFVEEHYRGRGVGEALLQSVARIAVERGYRRIDWMVLDSNRRAMRFYRSQGANPLTEWTMWRLSDDALMKLASE